MNVLIYTFALTLLFGCYGSAWAQTPKESSDIIRELLSTPAPPPRGAEDPPEKRIRPRKFFAKENVPPDDAPVEDLLEYWTHWASRYDKPALSNAVRQRLLDASIDDLEKLAKVVKLFQPSDNFAEKIKHAFDKGEGDPKLDYFREEIKKWLLFNSKFFMDELISGANNVKDDSDGFIENERALIALAKFNWPIAEPLLESLVNTGQQRSSALALTLLYQHSLKEKNAAAELKSRSKLQSIASNRSFPGYARDIAINVLSLSEWAGRDEWYLSLFKDETLIELVDGRSGFSPLSTLFTSDPDKWIPVMTKMVAGKDRTIQQVAASCLVRYAVDNPRRDAILPVLRWLTEPGWIPISDTVRSGFMQRMDDVDVPESVPGLIWIVENDEDHRRWAAGTLQHYKDPRAIPALKKALAETTPDDRPWIVGGLLASGGITETEQINALEAYATMLVTAAREGLERFRSSDDDGLSVPESIGRYLAQMNSPPDALVRAVFTRATNLQTKNPALSRSFMEIAHAWQGRQIDLDLVKKIAANTADANTIITALNRRDKLRESVGPELHLLIATGGVPKGIGAILLENADITASILSSSDQYAQIGLLASARLTQTPVAIELVGPLLKSKNSLLATTAERYLLVEDSRQARTLLWQHHPNEAFITGWRENIALIGGKNFDQIGKLEEKLRAELLKPDGPLEIYALLPNSDHYNEVLRVYPGKAVYTHYEDSSRYRERVVSKDDLSIFKQFVSTNGIAELGPQFGSCHHDCWVSEFLMLSRDAGRRIFNHQGIGGNVLIILANFQLLGLGDATTHYNFEKEIKGLEVLYADETLPVSDVWQRGNEIRILVERNETEEEKTTRTKDWDRDEDDNERAERWHRELVQYKARFSWRILKDKDAGSITTVPDEYSTFDETRFPFDEDDNSARRDARQVKAITPDSILIARNSNGLWRQVAGAKAVRISGESGAYANPVVTADGKWAVVAKTDSHWDGPHYLVRVNLETGRESRVKLEPADEMDAIAFLPLHGKILLRRAKDQNAVGSRKPVGPDVVEHYLFDPKAGELQPVSGEFGPLWQSGKRFLQSTGETGQYWAAIPDETKKQTVVGRYNLKDFSFKPVLTVPQISFDSMSMWVDEKQGKLYLVYKNHLLRLPLNSAP